MKKFSISKKAKFNLLNHFGTHHRLYKLFIILFAFVLGTYLGALLGRNAPASATSSTTTAPISADLTEENTAVESAANLAKLQQSLPVPKYKVSYLTKTIDVPTVQAEVMDMFREVIDEEGFNLMLFVPREDANGNPISRKILRVKKPQDPFIFYRGCVSISRPYIFTEILDPNANWFADDAKLKEKLLKDNPSLQKLKFWVSKPLTAADGAKQQLISVPADVKMRKQLDQMNLIDFFDKYQQQELFLPYAPVNQIDKNFEFTKQSLRAPNPNTLLSVGTGKERLPVHQLPFEIFHCQYVGDVKITLFDPMQYNYLYPERHGSVFKMSKKNEQRSQISVSSLLYSTRGEEFNQKYPLFSKVTPLKITVKQGECLFLPAFWLASMENGNGRNVRVTFLYEPHHDQLALFWKALTLDKKTETIDTAQIT